MPARAWFSRLILSCTYNLSTLTDDISTPDLCKAMSLLAFKPAYWFPKLSISVGRRTWSYDGEPEETYDAIIENAAGGSALRTWNCGPTALTDSEIDALLNEMAAGDYAPEEYDFFLRNVPSPSERMRTRKRGCRA